jgi:hypothetical protein
MKECNREKKKGRKTEETNKDKGARQTAGEAGVY